MVGDYGRGQRMADEVSRWRTWLADGGRGWHSESGSGSGGGAQENQDCFLQERKFTIKKCIPLAYTTKSYTY